MAEKKEETKSPDSCENLEPPNENLSSLIMYEPISDRDPFEILEELISAAKVIILDIEGTTTSADYVKDVLVPYAEKNYAKYIKENWEKEDVVKYAVGCLVGLQEEHSEVEGFIRLPLVPKNELDQEFLDKLILHLKWLQANKLYSQQLKFIQGLIWINGFKNKELEGHVYDDVPKALEKWSNDDKKIYIYSQASKDSQQILFKNSCYGDLDYLIDGYFDLKTGPKTGSISYQRIRKKLNVEAEDCLFFTDTPKESYAAHVANFKTVLVGRGPIPFVECEKEYYFLEDVMVPSFLPKKE